ncbi:MAG: cell division protein ZapA [Prevotellaceae bacterium]|jgi:cell division protein ZapA|nr:cell division protein ZapA [Prevotellaceae bacterium]
MDDGKVAANIMIAGKIYPMRIDVEDEEIFKKAEASIQNRIAERYNDEYSHIERQDILAITLLNVTAELLEYKELNNKRRYTIEKIDRELGVYLEKQCSLDNIE